MQFLDAEPLEALVNSDVDCDARFSSGGDPARESVRQAERAAVQDALRLISAEHREALYLHYCSEWSLDKIGKHLTLPETTIKGRLFRGREALRRRLLADSTFDDRVKGINSNERK